MILVYYGVSYYPEHKSEEELTHDIDLIVKSGINTVRMGEFAWCRFEPIEGSFHYDWLDRVVKMLGDQGIKSVICTPTACPPAWMVTKLPDMLYVDNRGVTRPFGGRRHYCYNNQDYRRYSKIIAENIAEHYGKNPYVLGFQIDNEPAQEVTGRCHCKACQKKFSEWLAGKYKTIEEFNRRSGAIFWSQEYDDFSQIKPPVNSIEVGAIQQINAFYENPTVRLDFERFCSEGQIEYQNIQCNVMKLHTDYPVTTNATGLATNSINNYESTKTLDNYAFDYYPSLRNSRVDSFPYSFARGVKRGKNFWVLEFMSGGGHRLSGSGRLQPNPNALKQAVLQSFAHGAEMMLHFQFRSYPIGAEQLNYAIVDLDGVPRRRYFEMQETAQILNKLKPLQKAEFANEVAISFDYDSYWAMKIKPANAPKLEYIRYATKLYDTLSKLGVNADVISLDDDFSKYKAVILPCAFLLDEAHQIKLSQYVAEGKTLITTFLSSVKNIDNVGYTKPLPAGLTDTLGITVEEVEPVFDENVTELMLDIDSEMVTANDGGWSELISGKASLIGKYTDTYKGGQGVISRNSYKKGTAYYLGTDVSVEALKKLLDSILKAAKVIRNQVCSTEKIEVVRRKLNSRDIYYLFNFSQESVDVKLNTCLVNYLSGEILTEKCSIEANGFAVLTVK